MGAIPRLALVRAPLPAMKVGATKNGRGGVSPPFIVRITTPGTYSNSGKAKASPYV